MIFINLLDKNLICGKTTKELFLLFAIFVQTA
jgi:hypothetical protein